MTTTERRNRIRRLVAAAQQEVDPLHSRALKSVLHGEVEKLIYDTVWKFRSTHAAARARSFDELLSDGNDAFLRALRSWQPGHGASFAYWLRRTVWHQLLSTCRRAAVLHERHRTEQPLPAELPQRVQTVRFEPGNLEEISPDAREVLRLALDLPHGAGHKRARLRSRLVQLLQGIGWAGERIARTFAEIGEALRA